jgi:hypothetical protein
MPLSGVRDRDVVVPVAARKASNCSRLCLGRSDSGRKPP